VHGYDEWGTDLLPRLNGMFAFAVLDRRKGTLLLARDRFGEKPLYYAFAGDGLVFASELKALLLHPGVPRAHDVRHLQKYFAYGLRARAQYDPQGRAQAAVRLLRRVRHCRGKSRHAQLLEISIAV
jgi:asparagine synthetase B (glutamine-hydrolysing)